MAVHLRRQGRGLFLLAMGLAFAGNSATVSSAQDFIGRFQNTNVSQVGYYDRACGGCTSCTPACGNGCGNGCGCTSAAPGMAPGMAPGGDMADMLADPDGMGDMSQRDLTAPVAPSPMLSSDFGAAGGGFSSAPNVIGDFFGGGINVGSQFSFSPSFPSSSHQEFTTATVGGGDRLLKIVEFNSPVPTDRVFFTYNHFHNAIQESIDGDVVDRNLDRFVFGAEKTFNGGNSSIELRLPFSAGLDAVQNTGDTISEEAVLFGDISIALKTILRRSCRTVVTGGLGMTVPTGPDSSFTFAGDTLFVDNDAVHLNPFIGVLHLPSDRLFLQSFLQFNFDVNGNNWATTDGDSGVIQSQTLMFLSGTVGYWIYRDPCNCGYVTGIAPVLELHYTSSLTDADNDGDDGTILTINDGQNRIDVLNLTAGAHFQMGPCSTLTVAAVAPLMEDQGKLFDAEIGVQFNRRF